MNSLLQTSEYQSFVATIKERIKAAQYAALRQVNRQLIELYWDIGKLIVERQQQMGWGKAVVETLARDLQAEFAGMQGFSARNLWYMRDWYDSYKDKPKLQPLVAEISWAKNIVILSKCKDDTERLFYLTQTRQHNWTKSVLIHKIETQTYQKTLLNQHNFENTLPDAMQSAATLALKDEYTFDFLELTQQHSEFELEQALLANVRKFLTEMGGQFAFIGNQYRLEVADNEYFIDLLLFHRALQCLVAIELKIDEFKPEYAGKMNFYLSVLNQTIRLPHENDAIGIIICKSKQRTIVEFALRDIHKSIGVATYTLTPTLPLELAAFFPTNEELVQRIEEFNHRLVQ